jgi:hypothetical protein
MKLQSFSVLVSLELVVGFVSCSNFPRTLLSEVKVFVCIPTIFIESFPVISHLQHLVSGT